VTKSEAVKYRPSFPTKRSYGAFGRSSDMILIPEKGKAAKFVHGEFLLVFSFFSSFFPPSFFLLFRNQATKT
jgi:hypothetical protein